MRLMSSRSWQLLLSSFWKEGKKKGKNEDNYWNSEVKPQGKKTLPRFTIPLASPAALQHWHFSAIPRTLPMAAGLETSSKGSTVILGIPPLNKLPRTTTHKQQQKATERFGGPLFPMQSWCGSKWQQMTPCHNNEPHRHLAWDFSLLNTSRT